MNYNLSIQKILLNVTNSNLDDQITLLKDAIKIADANNDLSWGYDLRTQLIDKYSYTSRSPIEFLVYFAWLLDAEDSDPSLSDNDYSLNIYPWILSSMCNTVSVSREQIDLVLQDYKTRLEKKGHTLKGYLESLVYWEIFKGNANEAKGYFEEYVKFCTKNSRVEEYALFMRMRIELIAGDLDKTLWYARDITNPATHHSIMKLYTYSVLTSYMTKEKDSRAIKMFEEAEKEFRIITKSKSSASIMAIADMLCYLSRHDQDKAWDYFSDYIYQTISLEDDTRLSFVEKVLPLFKDQDRKTLQIPHQLPYYKAEGIYDLKEVYDYYYATAKLLSSQFDERNGTNYFTKELSKSLEG